MIRTLLLTFIPAVRRGGRGRSRPRLPATSTQPHGQVVAFTKDGEVHRAASSSHRLERRRAHDHSITRSARSSSVCGMVSPSALAVLRLLPGRFRSLEPRQAGTVGGIQQNGDTRYGRHQLLENLQAFRRELGRIHIEGEPRDIGTRLSEARHETCCDRIHADRHDDRDRRRRLLRREGRRVDRRDDHIDPGADQLGGELGETVQLWAGAAVDKLDIAT